MKRIVFLLCLCFTLSLSAQENLSYQKPPKEILDLVDVSLSPSVLMDNNYEFAVLRYRDAYKTIAELSEVEMRLGGLRINPKTNIGSRTNYFNDLKILNIKEGSKEVQVKGLPEAARLANFSWSPDQKKIAFTHTTLTGVEVWVVDIQSATAKKITDTNVNGNMRDIINWFKDSQSMLVKMISKERKPLIDTKSAIPVGPTISTNDGKKAQNRTYQDLLKNPNDEHNFEQLALSEIYKVSLDGSKELWLGSDMYMSIDFSPDGNYVMVTTVEKPFSYLVPYYRFPSETVVYDKDAKLVKKIIKHELVEDLPKGFMAVKTGPRFHFWHKNKPSTLLFVQALDGGDPKNKVDFRDEVFEIDAPFNGEARSVVKTINRFNTIYWGNETTAFLVDYWWNTRNTKTYIFNPSDNSTPAEVISDRNHQDVYSDPGDFVTKKNEFGEYVVAIKKNNFFLIGDGYSKDGQFPFVDKYSLKTKKSERIYQSSYTDKVEAIWDYDLKDNKLLVRIESASEFPNYFFRNIKKKKLDQITFFENPFKGLQSVHKEVINYKRADGLDLSGTLYLPVGYDKEKKEKMPMILWAYPREYKDKASAGQSTQNPNKFTYPYYGSMIYWVTRGYVVLDGAAFPIVGEGDEEPNDSFREQLVANGKAAIDAVDKMGYIDRDRVAVGGHSYGAFMVANLLSHSDDYAAGIARSGAYNRTLTPFGFQSEERSYWDAPNVYFTMSPFMHADKMKYPLLLIHGEADNNSGTYPLQSERYFNALKGLGATVRLVMLPKESHGYRAKESILHLLWEQDQWLEKYVKNKK